MDPARTQAAADALGNVRAEHLEPSAAVQALLDRWARGGGATPPPPPPPGGGNPRPAGERPG
ncbi:MAG: hypothetical protein L0H64_24650, partial [Pseudonocardia sp.]|nr:hypothetical protein [Pseudonocardia sp.]